MPPPSALDQSAFHKLWSALPANRCDRGFWNGLEALAEPFLESGCPLRSPEYFTAPHTGRVEQSELHFIDQDIVAKASDMRMFYDAFTLWNPFALAALLKIPIAVVVEQLLLAVEYNFVSMRFVVSCRSCAFDLKHFTSVSEVPFHGTSHTLNAFRCPMCTDRTDVTSLSSVSVFFQLQRLHPIFQRPHHRSFVTEAAEKQRLETFFCPSGAGFATPLYLPRGKYLLAAPFMAGMVELDVQVGASAFGEKDPFLPRIIDLKNYCVEPAANMARGKLKTGGGPRASGGAGVASAADGLGTLSSPAHRVRAGGNGTQSYGGFQGRRSVIAPTAPHHSRWAHSHRGSHLGGGMATLMSGAADARTSNLSSMADYEGVASADAFGAPLLDDIAPTQTLTLRHGKVQLRVYNTTAYSGFMDLYIKFDRCAEFSASRYPKQLTLPDLLHCLPRGLRSRHLAACAPLPPSETPTKGVFVRHHFELDACDFVDAQVLAVLREVHRYSLEDQHGLLLSVSSGGTCFESSFLSVTAALASSMCFFQRVLVRLDETIAVALRTSITEGPLLLAAYQGQYNDADNMRSAYPDVQVVGPAVYASHHPPIIPPTLYATMVEAATPPVVQRAAATDGPVSEFRAALREEAFELATVAAAAKGHAAKGRAPLGKSFMPWMDDGDEFGGDGSATQAWQQRQQQRRQSEPAQGDVAFHRARNSVTLAAGHNVSHTTEAMVRFELRSVRRSAASGGITLADLRAGSVALKENYASLRRREREQLDAARSVEDLFGFSGDAGASSTNSRGRAQRDAVPQCEDDDDDIVLPYFLKYLVEQLAGTRVVEESHALVVLVPMSVMHAAVQLSNMLDRSSYIKEYLGPF